MPPGGPNQYKSLCLPALHQPLLGIATSGGAIPEGHGQIGNRKQPSIITFNLSLPPVVLQIGGSSGTPLPYRTDNVEPSEKSEGPSRPTTKG